VTTFAAYADSSILLRRDGLFRNSALYCHGDDKYIYAKWGTSFVRVLAAGDTTNRKISWLVASAPGLRRLGLRYVCGDAPEMLTISAED